MSMNNSASMTQDLVALDVIGVDLDMTLWDDHPDHAGPATKWDDPLVIAALVAHPIAVANLLACDHPLVFITGREEATRPHIQAKLESLGLGHIPLIMNPLWQGHDALKEFKSEAILEHRVALYIGDHGVDAHAAWRAGADFLDSLQWRQEPWA